MEQLPRCQPPLDGQGLGLQLDARDDTLAGQQPMCRIHVRMDPDLEKLLCRFAAAWILRLRQYRTPGRIAE
ncbi:MAG: hypothetical protein ACYSPI_04260 [Planctomycetota bacterium]